MTRFLILLSFSDISHLILIVHIVVFLYQHQQQ